MIDKNGIFYEKYDYDLLNLKNTLSKIYKLNKTWVVVSQNNFIKKKIILNKKKFFKVKYPLVDDMIFLTKLILEKKSQIKSFKKDYLIY